MDGEIVATVIGLTFTAIVISVFVFVFVKIAQSQRTKQRMEQSKQRFAAQQKQQTSASEAERRRQEELKQRLAQKYGRYDFNERIVAKNDEQEHKHAKHVEDSHEHGHIGEEEHYEEIVGSLGEINDEGCADLNGVRFLVTDLSYEIQSQETPDYDRLASAMVLGEIVNTPRFKTPYSRNK